MLLEGVLPILHGHHVLDTLFEVFLVLLNNLVTLGISQITSVSCQITVAHLVFEVLVKLQDLAVVVTQYPREDRILTQVVETAATVLIHKQQEFLV